MENETKPQQRTEAKTVAESYLDRWEENLSRIATDGTSKLAPVTRK